jgi:hypothetical protein
MKQLLSLLLAAAAMAAHAHVTDAPLVRHAVDHAWLALAVVPLLLLLPLRRSRQR